MTMTPTMPDSATDVAPRFEIVPAKASALPYVLSTWGRSLESKLEGKPKPGFLHDFAIIQANIIKRSQVLCAMAGERIAAFIVFQPPIMGRAISPGDTDATIPGVLHWISTRKEYRDRGAASALMIAAGIAGKPLITSWTSDLKHLRLADAPYRPFWLTTKGA